MTQSLSIQQLIEFKNWADQIYIEYISELTDEEYTQVILGKSIADIFYHIYEVMHYWLKRIDTSYTDSIVPDNMSRENILTGFENVNQHITDFVSSERYSDFTIQWDENDQPVTSNSTYVIFNFVTHSAYHRGQLALLLRNLGLEWIKETDFNPWIYEIGQHKK